MRTSTVVLIIALITASFLVSSRFDQLASLWFVERAQPTSSAEESSPELEAPFVWGQNMFVDFRMVGVPTLTGLTLVSLVLLVVSSVWLAYAYVLAQTFGMRTKAIKPQLQSPLRGGQRSWRIALLVVMMPVAGLADAMIVQLSGFDVLAGAVLIISLVAIEVIVFWEMVNRALKQEKEAKWQKLD